MRRAPTGASAIAILALSASVAFAAPQAAGAKPAPPPPPAKADAAAAKAGAAKAAAKPAAAAGNELAVTVTYKGKGTVGKGHEITVFVFDTPNITTNATPVAHQVLLKNGGTAKFSGLTVPDAYIAVTYDESGKFEEGQGPPPPGTPFGLFGSTGDGSPATAMKPGKGAKATVTFDDSRRVQ